MYQVNCIFSIRGEGEIQTIQVKVHANGERFRASTGLKVNKSEWDAKMERPKAEQVYLRQELTDLQGTISQTFENFQRDGVLPFDWLKTAIKNHFERDGGKMYLTTFVDEFIKKAPTRKNATHGVGLKENSLKNYKKLKKVFLLFEQEERRGKKIEVNDLTGKFVQTFKDWLFLQKYSTNTIAFFLTLLKTLCKYIDEQDIPIDIEKIFKRVQIVTEKKAPEEVIYLNFEELERLEELLPTLKTYDRNALKWLLLGCEIGQRGGDLMKITNRNIKQLDGYPTIELTQIKTGKEVIIPLTERAKRMIKDGLPETISANYFGQKIKELCKIAGIDTPVKVKNIKGKREAGEVPKYEAVSTHICRRSFASNYYGILETGVLRTITGHATEDMFLRYIGRTAHDNAKAIIRIFKDIEKEKVA